MALQLPESEVRDGSTSRLVDKFPSTTTLWLVLRKFESGAPGETAARYNFTARGIPQTTNGSSGSGRLVYETPVVQVMGRELSAFTDLQKSLAQLGLNGGSVLLRLSFRPTQTPLEEAMAEMEEYFRSIDTHESSGAHAESVGKVESIPDVNNPDALKDRASTNSPPASPLDENEEPSASYSQGGKSPAVIPESGNAETSVGSQLVEEEPVDDATVVGPDQRPITIYAPPTETTPQASRRMHPLPLLHDQKTSANKCQIHLMKPTTNSPSIKPNYINLACH